MSKDLKSVAKHFIIRTTGQTVILIAVVSIVVALLAVLLGRKFNRTIYHERQQMLSMVAHTAAQTFTREVNAEWNVYDLSYSIAANCAENAEDIESCISQINYQHDFGSDFYFLVDDNGNYFCSDGVDGKLADFTHYTKTSHDRVEYLSTLPHLNPNKSYMIYRGRFDNVLRLDSDSGPKTIVFFAYAQDLTDLKNSIGGMFRNPANVFITDSKGALLYEDYGLTKVLEGNNIFKKFRLCTMPFGENADELESACKEGDEVVVALKIKGNDYYFCSTPLTLEDWSLSLLLLPYEMEEKLSNGIWALIVYIVGILMLVGAMLVFLTYSNRMVAQEQRLEESARLVTAIEEASRAKTVFLSNMSHDIRTPINGIMGVTTLARASVDNPEKITEYLDKIDTASGHLLSLINDVLDMSRIESGKTQIHNEPSDIREIVESCGSIINGQLAGRNIRFNMEISADHPFILADDNHLKRVFINILGNAVKFTNDGGRILFRCHETSFTDEKVTYAFEFKDTGIGMSKQFVSHVFEAFSQEENRERTQYKGTGLGLSITKQLVELMGGTIDVESAINKGTSFTVIITFDRDLSEHTAPEEETPEAADINGVKILLVEDNELNMEIAECLLTANGAVVDKAWDGLEAIDRFTSKDVGTYDVILMDVMMPRMNGYEATKAIRSLGRDDAKEIPIIAMTANAFDEDIRATQEAGMNAHLSKPIDIDAVMHTIASFVHNNK